MTTISLSRCPAEMQILSANSVKSAGYILVTCLQTLFGTHTYVMYTIAVKIKLGLCVNN